MVQRKEKTKLNWNGKKSPEKIAQNDDPTQKYKMKRKFM